MGLSATLGIGLQALWGMINNLQLVTHTPLFLIPYSAIILTYLQTLFTIVNFDIFNSADNLQTLFQLEEVEYYNSYNEVFTFMGYDNSSFIYIVGFPVFVLLLYLCFIPVFLISSLFKHKIAQRVKEYLRKILLFNGFFRYFLELSLESGFGLYLNINNPEL